MSLRESCPLARSWLALALALAFALSLSLSLLAGCAEPQHPYQFSTSQMAREPIEALAAALTQAGQGPIVVDPKTGTVHTRWVDTGAHGKPIKDQETTIVRRYSASVVHGSFGNEVSISADEKFCVVRAFTLTELDVEGNCVPVERLNPQHREELMKVGSRVQQSMSIP